MPVLHMQTEAVRATGQQINQISESLHQAAQQLRGRAQQLTNEWQGPSASMFEQEMQTLLQRALQSAEMGVALNQKVQREVDEWEGAAQTLGDTGNYTKDDITSKNNNDPETVLSKDMAIRDTHEVFSKDYMEDMIGKTYQGGNDPKLNDLMEQFLAIRPPKSPPDEATKKVLDEIANIRGESPESFYKQYEKYVQLYSNQSTKPDINTNLHPNFLGSTVSLRYGQVVGDVFGIDPIFGSLLNPTGGLVGPASESYQPSENDVLGYHGVFHDAAGFLYNYHGNIGPGYNYLQTPDYYPTEHERSGQAGGILWWASHPQLTMDVDPLFPVVIDIPHVPEYVEKFIGEGIEMTLVPLVRSQLYTSPIAPFYTATELIQDAPDFVESAVVVAQNVADATVNTVIETGKSISGAITNASTNVINGLFNW